MKNLSLKVSYYPKASTRRPFQVNWDGKKPVFIGFPLQWMIEPFEGGIRIRDLKALKQHTPHEEKIDFSSEFKPVILSLPEGQKFVITKLRAAEAPFIQEVQTGSLLQVFVCKGDYIVEEKIIDKYPYTALTPSTGQKAFELSEGPEGYTIIQDEKEASYSKKEFFKKEISANGYSWRFALADRVSVPFAKVAADAESVFFKKSLNRTGGAFAALMALMLILPMLMPEEKKEELIPTKFAKLIMVKPKAEKQMARTSGAAGAAGNNQPTKATNTAVAQAFRTKAVQNAIQGLLKGGLSKFAMTANAKTAGRMIASVGTTGGPGSNLGTLASAMMGNQNIGVASVGGGSGYGAGTAAGVAGQGGSFVGLDTGASEVDEGLTKEEVGRVIHAHMSEIRYCYESAMLQNSNLEGKIMIDFKIGPNGMVNGANEKESGISDPRVGSCVTRRLMTWPFPHPRGGVTVSVSYPFLFKTLKR